LAKIKIFRYLEFTFSKRVPICSDGNSDFSKSSINKTTFLQSTASKTSLFFKSYCALKQDSASLSKDAIEECSMYLPFIYSGIDFL
jgi:hypothetical protein